MTPEIADLWQASAHGVSGYGDVPTLAYPADLYETAWSLLLAHAAHVATTVVQPRLVVSELQSVVEQRTNAGIEATNINSLNQLHLATEALLTLGARPAPTLEKAVSSLRDQGQYRAAPNASPSWGWTYLAVQTLRDAGMPVPAEVLSSLESALPRAQAARTISAVTQIGLPVIGALALLEPERALRSDGPLSRSLLGHWESLVLSEKPSGPGLGFLLALHSIAAAEGLQFPLNPARWYRSLQTKTYYSFIPGSGPADAQVTYDAVALGAPLSNAARAALSFGEMPQGWITLISSPAILTTFDAVFADRFCGVIPHASLMRQQLTRWLGALNGNSPPSSLSADDIGRLCWLAKDYGIDISAAERGAMAGSLQNTLISAIQPSNAQGASGIGNALQDAASCNMRVTGGLKQAIEAYLPHAAISTLSAAFGLGYAANTLGDPAQLLRAKEAASGLKIDGGYEMSSQNGFPNIISTCYGYEIAGWPSTAVRSHSLASYQTMWGPSFLPQSVTMAQAPAPPTVELASLAFGLVMAAKSSLPVPLT